MKKLMFLMMSFGLMVVAADAVTAQTKNIALNKKATQSSTAFNSPASNAVNGKTIATFDSKDISHTNDENGGWWQVDLEKVYDIDKIEIWNRADDCCWDRLKNFYVMVSETPITSNSTAKNTSGPHSFTESAKTHPSMVLNEARRGRYVRIFLDNGTKPLSLGEVQVFGREIKP